ncbi:MAG: ATP-binding protein [Candidatus Thorarchaeota archaeon]
MAQKKAQYEFPSRETFTQLISSLPVGVALVTTELEIIPINDAFESLLCEKYEHVIRSQCRRILEAPQTEGNAVLAPDRGHSCFIEVSCQHGPRYVRLTSVPHISSEGRRQGWLLVAIDVTEWKKDQLELEAAAHQIVYLRNLALLLSQSDRDLEEILFSVVHIVPEGWSMPDRTSARVKVGGLDVQSANYDESTRWYIQADIAAFGSVVGFLEVRFSDVNNQYERNSPFSSTEEGLLQVIASEIGRFLEHRWVEQDRLRQQKELEIYNSLLRHDIRNDLGIVMTNIELARATIKEPSTEILDVFGSIEAVCERMMQLLTAFSRSPSERHRSLAQMLRDICTKARAVYPRLSVELEIEPDADTARIPESLLLPMVFENLIRNTVTHAGPDSRIEISLRRSGTKLIVYVSDDGPGIDPSIRGRLFEKGVSTRGGGLGLYLSREVIRAIGGTIEISDDYRPLPGATFKVTVPMIVEMSPTGEDPQEKPIM